MSKDRIVSKNSGPQSKFERILVTGGAGFIGSHLVDALVSDGCKVTIFDNLSSGTLKNIEPRLNSRDAQLVKGDIRNLRKVKEALRDVDVVFHLAAIVSVPYSVENPTVTNEVNAMGTRNLLETSASNDVKRFVYVSSCAVYGDPQYLPIDENHPINPMSPYAESKVRGEEYCNEFQEKCGLKTVTLRLFNVYGLRQSASEYSGVITRFIKSINGGEPPVIYGDGQQTRDFVHVSDVIQALLLSIKNNNALGQIFNIGSGELITINELCHVIIRKLKFEIEPVYKEPRSGDIKYSCAKIEKAQRILRYKPKTSIEKGIEDFTKQRVCGFE